MNGEEFYLVLRNYFNPDMDEKLKNYYGNHRFTKWISKSDSSFSFQFTFGTNTKSVPKSWIVMAKDAHNNGASIDRNWFNTAFNENNFNDCRASAAMALINMNL